MKRKLHYTVTVEVDDNGDLIAGDIGEGIQQGIDHMMAAGCMTRSDNTSTIIENTTVCFSHSEVPPGCSTPEIHRVLFCSTGHLCEDTAAKMLLEESVGPFYYAIPYGYMIVVPGPDVADPNDPETGWPQDIQDLLTRARAERCAYLRLDQDASALDGLPTYER